MTKQHILDEIKRTAQTNGGVPVGQRKFRAETGIHEYEWQGKYWLRWSEATQEAGYSANTFIVGYDEEFLLKQFTALIRELGCFPLKAQMRMKRLKDESFPSEKVFRQFGSKSAFAKRLIDFCKKHGGNDDVMAICEKLTLTKTEQEREHDEYETGFVYLLKSGKYYKIGKSNAAGRRERELQIQLPEVARILHAIRTDDPTGIEVYWHNRFASKRLRKDAEWFDLDAGDIKIFRRRKFM